MLFLLATACESVDSSPQDSPADSAEPGDVRIGAVCAIEARVGEVGLWASGTDAYLSAVLYDRPNPWYGPPTLANDSCAYHHTDTAACGACDDGQVCGWSGECEAEARVVVDTTLEITADGVAQTFTADSTTGQLWGVAGPLGATYTMTLTFADQTVEVPDLQVAEPVTQVEIIGHGDSMAPTSLDASWAADLGRVRTTIPINHHAGGPTFTRCDVEASTRAFHATEDMLLPLAVSTGLEFQGIDHAHTAAVTTELGCVEVRLGSQQYVGVTWVP